MKRSVRYAMISAATAILAATSLFVPASAARPSPIKITAVDGTMPYELVTNEGGYTGCFLHVAVTVENVPAHTQGYLQIWYTYRPVDLSRGPTTQWYWVPLVAGKTQYDTTMPLLFDNTLEAIEVGAQVAKGRTRVLTSMSDTISYVCPFELGLP